jgi:putative spermidine/putrescine transport system permease protein
MASTTDSENDVSTYRPALIAPLGVVWVVIYVVPLLLLLAASFLRIRQTSIDFSGLTLENYSIFLTDPFYIGVLLRTAELALLATAVTLVLGVPYAVLCTEVRPALRSVMLILVMSPALMSAVARSYGWIVLLGNNGALNYGLLQLGVIERPLHLLFNFFGVTLGLAQLLLPFMVLPIVSVLQRTDSSLVEAAANLGATRMQTVFRITLPLGLPGILAGATLVFVSAYAQFAVPQLLGGGAFLVSSTMVYQEVTSMQDEGAAAALAMIMLNSSLFIVLIGNFLTNRLAWAGD